MNQEEMVAQIAEATGLSKAAAKDALKAVVNCINTGLTTNGRVAVPELGTFTISHRAERTGRNVKTGEALTIAAKNVPSFKAAPKLKQSAAEGKAPTKA